MKINIFILGIFIYQKFLKNILIGLIVERNFIQYFFLEEMIVNIRNSLDILFSIVFMCYLVSDSNYFLFLIVFFGSVIIYGNINTFIENKKILLKEAIIHLIIDYYYYLLLGYHFEKIIEKINNNIIIDYLKNEKGGLIYNLEKISHKLNDQSFNYLLIIINKTNNYSSESNIYEMEYLINNALNELYALKKEKADKMNEFLMIPMSLHLINMIFMIVVPYVIDLM